MLVNVPQSSGGDSSAVTTVFIADVWWYGLRRILLSYLPWLVLRAFVARTEQGMLARHLVRVAQTAFIVVQWSAAMELGVAYGPTAVLLCPAVSWFGIFFTVDTILGVQNNF